MEKEKHFFLQGMLFSVFITKKYLQAWFSLPLLKQTSVHNISSPEETFMGQQTNTHISMSLCFALCLFLLRWEAWCHFSVTQVICYRDLHPEPVNLIWHGLGHNPSAYVRNKYVGSLAVHNHLQTLTEERKCIFWTCSPCL